MEPKIVTKPAFTVVGMLYHGKNPNNEIAQMWQEFNPRTKEIKHVVDSRVCYGVCSDMKEDDTFKYVAGLEVSSSADVPEGLVSWQVPEQKYAVFPCTLPTIRQAYEHAFQTWLPQSGYQRAQGPDLELYDEDFEPQIQDSQMHIYIPIE